MERLCNWLALGITFVTLAGVSQESMDVGTTTARVRGFGAATAPAAKNEKATLNTLASATSASLGSSAMLEKMPARLSNASKPVTPANGQKPLGPSETRVLETGIDAKDFMALIGPTLGKNLTAKQVDASHVAATGTSESLRRVMELSEQLKSAMRKPVKKLQLRVALLTDEAPGDTSASNAIARRELPQALTGFDLAAADFDQAGVPDSLWKVADLTAPVSGGGENRVQLNDRMALLYELRQTLAGDYEVALNLAEKEKGANPFDTGVGRIVFANHFRADANRPVILGTTTPNRTLMLVFRLRAL